MLRLIFFVQKQEDYNQEKRNEGVNDLVNGSFIGL